MAQRCRGIAKRGRLQPPPSTSTKSPRTLALCAMCCHGTTCSKRGSHLGPGPLRALIFSWAQNRFVIEPASCPLFQPSFIFAPLTHTHTHSLSLSHTHTHTLSLSRPLSSLSLARCFFSVLLFHELSTFPNKSVKKQRGNELQDRTQRYLVLLVNCL